LYTTQYYAVQFMGYLNDNDPMKNAIDNLPGAQALLKRSARLA